MYQKVILTITSLLSIFLFTVHWVDEIARGLEPGDLRGLGGILILVVWLYGTLALADRRAGLVIILLGSILGSGVLVLHMMGRGLTGPRIVNTGRVFLWVGTLIALGATASFSVILAARGLWTRQWGQSR